jgi:hypothetical protein
MPLHFLRLRRCHDRIASTHEVTIPGQVSCRADLRISKAEGPATLIPWGMDDDLGRGALFLNDSMSLRICPDAIAMMKL